MLLDLLKVMTEHFVVGHIRVNL